MRESSYDIIVVDIEDGSRGASTEGPELVAPPAWVIESGMLNHVARALAPGGVVALNVVGEERARQMVAEQLNRHFDDVFGCNAAPHDDGAEQREGAVFACAGTVTGALEMGTADAYRGQLRQGMSRLGLSEERPLVDDPDGWIDERLVTWPVR